MNYGSATDERRGHQGWIRFRSRRARGWEWIQARTRRPRRLAAAATDRVRRHGTSEHVRTFTPPDQRSYPETCIWVCGRRHERQRPATEDGRLTATYLGTYALPMRSIQLGPSGPSVSAVGFGCNSLSLRRPRDDAEGFATLMAALEAGITFLDTADFYGHGHNEMLIGRALRGHRREAAFLSVKCNSLFSPSGAFLGLDGRPSAIKNHCGYSLQRLGLNVIDLYAPSRKDPAVPFEETVGAIADLIAEGKVRYLGLSEVGADDLRRAHAVHPVTALEIEYSLAARFIEREILPTARELGVGIVAYRVLADGLLSGAVGPEPAGDEGRLTPPRLLPPHRAANVAVIATLREMAAAKGYTPAQLAVAWVLTRGDHIVPLVGISRRARVAENLASLDVRFTVAELATLEQVFAPGAIAGGRYPEFVERFAAR